MVNTFSLVQRFAAETEPGGDEKEGGVGRAVEAGERAIAPRHEAFVVHDEVADIIPFEVRDDEIDGGEKGANWFALLHGDLVQVAAQAPDADDDDEGDGAIRGGRGEDDRAEQDEG